MGCREPALDEKQRRLPLAPKQRGSGCSSHGNSSRFRGALLFGAGREHFEQW